MKKLIAALVAGLFAAGVFAAAPSTVDVPSASIQKVAMKHKAHKKHHKSAHRHHAAKAM
jgi:hypothetical protein